MTDDVLRPTSSAAKKAAYAAFFAAVFTPSLAWAAQDVCRHPLAGGACFGVFSLVSVPYTLIAATYAAGALVILKSQLTRARSRRALALVVPFCWAMTMVGFLIGGLAGWLTYPHDASPFFYIDWFVAVLVLVATSLYVVSWRLGQDATP